MITISCQKDDSLTATDTTEISLRGDDGTRGGNDGTGGNNDTDGNGGNDSENDLTDADNASDCDIDNPNIRILFIGNSYTDNFTTALPTMFEELAIASGRSIGEVASRAQNGWTLTDHLNSSTTINKINQGDWDYVVLQENGGLLYTGGAWGQFGTAVTNLTEVIREQSPNAQIHLFQLPVPVNHNSGNWVSGNENWDEKFKEVADLLNGVEVTRVSWAFDRAYHGWGTPGVGSNGSDLLRQSDFHFRNTGGFLAATTFYADLYQEKPCVPQTMTFINGTGLVANNVFNMEAILHVGYYTGYNFSLNLPVGGGGCTMWWQGAGPCD